MKRDTSAKIALSGIFGALAITVMLMGSIIPFSTFAAPALAGILIVPVAIEFGTSTGVLLYVAISILALFIAPDKEMAMMFVFFMGYYPLLKATLDKVHMKVLQLLLKLLVFNVAVIAMYGILIFLFRVDYIVAEFGESGTFFLILLLLLGNVTFVIYDVALTRTHALYLKKIRPRFIKMH